MNDETGAALIIVSVILVLFGILAAGLLRFSTHESRTVRQITDDSQSVRSKISGLNVYRKKLRNDRWWKADGSETYPRRTIRFAGGKFTLTTSTLSPPLRERLDVITSSDENRYRVRKLDPGLFTVYAPEWLRVQQATLHDPVYSPETTLEAAELKTVLTAEEVERDEASRVRSTDETPLELPAAIPYEIPKAVMNNSQTIENTRITFQEFEETILSSASNVRVRETKLVNSSVVTEKQLSIGQQVVTENPDRERVTFFSGDTMTITLTEESNLSGSFVSNQAIKVTGQGILNGYLLAPRIEIRGKIDLKSFRHHLDLDRRIEVNPLGPEDAQDETVAF